MTPEEARRLAPEELVQKLKEIRMDLFSARVKHSTGQLESTARLRTLRRDISRMETILREKREAQK